MGKTRGPYEAEYPEGSVVRVVSREDLEMFMRDWRWHNKLQADQLNYAGRVSKVVSVGFYHGGDELYTLQDLPGVWHEQCLVLIDGSVG